MEPDQTADGHVADVSGDPWRFCGARLKQQREDGRTTCENARGFKTTHVGYGTCHLHGGRTASGVTAAAKEREARVLEDAKHAFGLPESIEPGEALLQLLAVSAGASGWLTRMVQELNVETIAKDGKPHPVVALWQEERKETRQVAKAAHDAGLGERMVRLEEDKARFVVALIEGLLRRLDEYVVEQTGKRILDPMDAPVRAIVASVVAEVQEVTAA